MTSDQGFSDNIAAIGNKHLFQTIVAAIPSAVFIFQGEAMRYVNASALSITDYSKEELLAMPFWAVIHEDFQDMVKQRGLARQSDDNVPASYDVKIVRKDGEARWVNFRASMIELDGKPAVLGLAEDINERKQGEERLLQARSVSELLVDYNELTAMHSLDEVIQKTLEFLHGAFAPHESSVAIVEMDQNSFCLKASMHCEQLHLNQGISIPFHATVLSEVIQSRLPRYRADIQAEHPLYETDHKLLKNGFCCDFLVPLWAENQCLGTLNMGRSDIDAFSEHERELICLVAARLAPALHNASLFYALRESEEQYRSLIEDSPDMIHSLNAEGIITSVNLAELETMEYSREEYIGKSVLDVIHPDCLEATKHAFASVLSGQTIKKYETALVTKSGKKIDVEVSVTPKTVSGDVVSTRAIIRDITERKQKEIETHLRMQRVASQQKAMLQLSTATPQTLEEMLRKICEVSAKTLQVECVSSWLLSEGDSKLRCLNLFDLSEAKHVSGTVLKSGDFPHYFAALRSDRAVEAHDAQSDPRTCEFTQEYLLPLGITSMLDVPIRLNGKVVGVVCHEHTGLARRWTVDEVSFSCDVADQVAQALINEKRKRSEEETRASKELIESIIENAPIRVFWKDRNFRYLGCNTQFAKDAGHSCSEDLIGKTDFDMTWKDQAGLYQDDDAEVMNSGISKLNYEEPQTTPDGKTIWLRTSKVPLYDANKEMFGVLGIYDDITERKKFSEILQDSESRLLEAQHIARLGHYVFDVKADSWICSKELDNIFGIDGNFKRDVAGWLLAVHPDDKEMMLNYLQDDVLTQHKKFDKEYKIINLKTGHERWVHGLGSLKFNNNKEPVEMFGTIQDITESKRAEELVRKLSNSVTHAGGSIMITDRAGIIEYVNPAFEKMTGYSAEDVIGQTPRILNSGNQDAAFYERMWYTITSGNIWHGKVIDKRKDGSFFPAVLTIAPITDDKGLITHFVGSHADISELEEMEAQFHQAQKMEAIGTLVGGIAHDFNNMLAGMTGNLYLAKQRTHDMPDVVQRLANIEQLSFRAAEMIQQLLAFARKSMVSMKTIPFTPFIKETLKLLRPSVPENIGLHQDICSESLTITGDATQLHQLLMNLVNNARDAVETVDAPTITVRLDVFHADDIFLETHAYFTAGLYAHLSVEDNGCGIPEHQIEHLFEPFFTTKEQGKGTGLGLAMVFGAVKTHHGFVEVDSREGQGSTFHVYLPLLEPEEIVSTSVQEDAIAEGHGELIMLVDDEQHIIETGKEVLQSLGYKVLTATDGRQAVELYKAHADAIDLCIFDIVMPVMGGDAAAQQIRQIKPDVKIIFATGYDKNLQTDMQHEAVLSKPFSIAEMSQLIRQQLDS